MARRMARRSDAVGTSLGDGGNQWLMRTLARQCERRLVSAVHSYEDCALGAFEQAKRLGKACIYDMPIGYQEAWLEIAPALYKRYAEWVAPHDRPSATHPWLERKRREMQLADIVLAASTFTIRTIQRFHDKPVYLARYGSDASPSAPAAEPSANSYETLRFLYAGHVSIRKGTPLLLNAWRVANLRGATLDIAGAWRLAESAKSRLPPHARYLGHMGSNQLQRTYRESHVLVFPSYFEGFGLVVSEALAAGLPVIVSEAATEVDDSCGRTVPTGDQEALVEALRWFSEHRDQLPAMRRAALAHSARMTWESYRAQVAAAVTPYCS